MELVNDLKRTGTTATKVTVSNKHSHHGLNSCSAEKVPLLKPEHIQALWRYFSAEWTEGLVFIKDRINGAMYCEILSRMF